jgi:hypothetical protein
VRTFVSRAGALLTVAVLGSAAGACNIGGSTSPTPAQAPQAQPAPYPQQQGYPQQQYPQQQGYPQQAPPAQPAPQVMPAQRPLLPPLVGVPAQQQEVRQILGELVAALSPDNRAKVANIPMTFDPTFEVNAFAGCDERRQPFMAATAGILEAVDAIAQTRATDELFGTKTYDAYSAQVLPQLSKSETARAGLPAGIIPTNLGPDLRRWSRAREIFQEVMAFTMGHELAHHYLGHTGCANGQPMSNAPDPALLGRLLTRIPTFNQVAEAAADSSGAIDVLAAGRARRPQYAWTENGGLFLLDYFARIESAGGGGGPLTLLSPVQFLRTHPNPLARIPLVQTVARTWRAQNPG